MERWDNVQIYMYSRTQIIQICVVLDLLNLQWVAELKTSHSADASGLSFKGYHFSDQMKLTSGPIQLIREMYPLK